MLVRHKRPVPLPEGTILVAPSPQRTIDGSRPAFSLVIRPGGHRTGVRHVPAGAAEPLTDIVETLIDHRTAAIWLGNRNRLADAIGGPPVGIESALFRLAREHTIAFRGFTGNTEREPRDLGLYAEVREEASLNGRQSNTRA